MIVRFSRTALGPCRGFILCGFLLSSPPELAAVADIVRHEFQTSSDAVKNYWTPARMMDALKHPVPMVIGGSPSSCPGCGTTHSMPDPMPRLPVLKEKIACPVTRYDWKHDTNNKEFPEKAMGKLFLQDHAGNNFVCSASLVNKKVLLTAGHCVSENIATLLPMMTTSRNPAVQ